MDKTLRESFIYKDRDATGPAGAFYCILRPKTLSFHLRKVHKRHTPLKLFKIEELSVNSYENDITNNTVDCNSNKTSRYYWQINTKDSNLLVYCLDEGERKLWISTIERAKGLLEEKPKETRAHEETVKEKLNIELCGDLTCSRESDTYVHNVYNSSHTATTTDEPVGIKQSHFSKTYSENSTTVQRVRSRSLSELIDPSEHNTKQEYFIRSWKSNSAPPAAGGVRFKTVDKLIDVHSLWCRQLARWIEN